jgi:hypothetical protein
VRSEVAIICQLARAVLGSDHPVPWQSFLTDDDRIRDAGVCRSLSASPVEVSVDADGRLY